MHFNNVIENSFIKINSTIFEALNTINKNGLQIALVVDNNNILKGIITDGDIRRALLKGYKLTDFINDIYNSKFHKLFDTEPRYLAEKIIRENGFNAIPVINKFGIPIEIIRESDIYPVKEFPNPILIMAGGKGKRLMPMTEDCPKPMLLLDNQKPILQVIIEKFKKNGFKNFFLSVNYKKEKIIDYFKDGSEFGVKIQYLIEDEPLGTAGSLYLLPKSVQLPIICVNGDVITNLDYSEFLKFHSSLFSEATMCVREIGINIQFGVVNSKGSQFESIDEKPVIKKKINTGIYLLNPSFIRDLLPNKRKIDMPEIFIEATALNKNVNIFPLHDYWIDIGLPESFEKAKLDYKNIPNIS